MAKRSKENAIFKTIQSPDSCIVKGQVLHPDRTPFINGLVRAFDQDIRHEQSLGQETRIAKDGRYEIYYQRNQFSRAEKKRADIIVRVFDKKGKKLLAASPLIFNAKPVEIVDLIISNSDYKGPSEYDQLLEGAGPLLVNVKVKGKGTRKQTIIDKLAELKEDEHQQEITFLACEMSAERQLVTFLVMAARLKQKTKLPPAVFYGFFRYGLPTPLPTLLAQKPETLRHALESAVRQNFIPEFDKEPDLDKILVRIKELRIAYNLEASDQPGKASLGEILETALPGNRDKLELFLKHYLEHQDKEEKEPIKFFWKSLRETEEFKDDIDILQFTLQVATLTKNHIPLVREFHQKKLDGKLQTPRDWAKMDADALMQLIQKQQPDGESIGFPSDVPGKNDEEKRKNYVTMMVRFIEDEFPTPVIAHRIVQDNRPEESDLIKFFHNNQAFEFSRISVDAYLEQNSQTALKELDDPGDAVRNLKGMQRLFKVTSRYSELSVLRDGGLTSAHNITSLGKDKFLELYGDALGGPELTIELFNRACQTEAMAMVLISNHSRHIDRTDVAAIAAGHPSADASISEELAEMGIAIPTWTKLFATPVLCDCEHCRSVYSPAAYLVDILDFLNPKTEGHNPLEILYERRPDLGTLDLSCDNTNTTLPYVDLVNEVLENVIAPLLPVFSPFPIAADRKQDLDNCYLSSELIDSFDPSLSDGATIVVLKPGREWRILDTAYAYSVLDEDPADDTVQVVARGWQTYATADELKANPQYTNPDAYERLAEAVYPWNLPFDCWHTEVGTYLEHLGVQRHDLMTTFQSRNAEPVPDENFIAGEYLGLTHTEWQILTDTYPSEASPFQIWQYWGYPGTSAPTDWIEALSQVSAFLQASGLTYRELLELLCTRFVNQEGILLIVSTDLEDLATCDHTKLEITNLERYALDRIHRFVRLWRTLDWPMFELDKAIDTLKPVDRTVSELNAEDWAELLQRISKMQQLKVDLKRPVIEMLSWWALIDTTETIQSGERRAPSLYDDIFQNKIILDSSEDMHMFRLNDDKSQLQAQTPFREIQQADSSLCATLGINATDLALLIVDLSESVEDITTANDLNLENLSYLYRVVSLSKALELSIQEYLTIRELTGLKPLLGPTRLRTLDEARVYPEDTLYFIQTLKNVQDASFEIDDLDYLLRYHADPYQRLAPDNGAIELLLTEIRMGLQTISSEQVITPDLSGDLTRQKLLLLEWEPALVEDVIAVLNNSKRFSVPLTAPLPIELPLRLDDIPDVLTSEEKVALKRKISLNTLTDSLCFEGAMSENEQVALLSLSSDVHYETSIENLFQAPRQFVVTWMKAFYPIVSVPLIVLPPTAVFPEVLRHKISYDVITRELRYTGVMTEPERDDLLAVSVDPIYQAAIRELYSESNVSLAPDDENAFLNPSDAAALFDEPEKDVPERFNIVLEKLIPYLRATLSRSLITQMLSDALNIETAMVTALLTERMNAISDPGLKAIEDFLDETFVNSQSTLMATGFPAQYLTFERLHKIASLIANLKISTDTLDWIFEHGSDLGWLNPAELPVQSTEPNVPYSTWSRFLNGLRAQNLLPSNGTTFFELLDLIRSFETIDGNAKEVFLSALTESTTWRLEDIEFLVGQKDNLFDTGLLELVFPDDFQSEKALLILSSCFNLIKQLGATAQQVSTWAQPELSFEQARSIKQIVKAKYENARWLEVAKPLRDVLREQQRTLLVAYLVHHADLWLSNDEIVALHAAGQRPDANKLYGHLLLDVEMTACMMTSRIKQAGGSVQLFVQRCLMGLEEGASFGREAAQKWTWMKNYRVWEANRKIFLYPENWIEPELRDDKTPFFNDLENALQQNEINQDTVQSAYLKYLEKLDAVARLNMRGMYHHFEATRNTLHVFGRTEGTAPTYYYRRGVDYRYWTAWEEVDVDIESDHLIPVVHQGRLKLFWPIFTEKQEEPESESVPGKMYWEIQLAWSEYKDGAWSTKKISSETETLDERTGFNYFHAAKSLYTFKALQWGHNLAIVCFSNATEDEFGYRLAIPVGVFMFTDCHNKILAQGLVDINVLDILKPGTYIKQIPFPLINKKTAPLYQGIINLHTILSPECSYSKNVFFAENDNISSEENDTLKITPDYCLGDKVSILQKTPGTFELLYQNQHHWYLLQLLYEVNRNSSLINILYLLLSHPEFQFLRIPSSFFYQDDFRTFFVIPVTWPPKPKVFEEDNASPEYLGFTIRNFGEKKSPISTTDADLSKIENETILPPMTLAAFPDWHYPSSSQYLFKSFYHPYLCHFIEVLNRHGVEGLLRRDIQLLSDDFFELEYEPEETVVKGKKIEIEQDGVTKEIYSLYPRDEVDFDYDGAYSQYNWELFFHIPLMIAERLSNNQRFAEAQQWFHYIFDPTDASDNAVPKRYWCTRPFYEASDEQYQNQQIRRLLRTLADEDSDTGMRSRLENQVKQWRENPFKPHLIARLRTTAYQKAVVMKYLDNLIAWGDYLFHQDSIESINEATQLYILASEILGVRPQWTQARGTPATKTVNDLVLNPDLDDFSNLLEDALPPAYSASGEIDAEGLVPFSLGSVLYFCVPRNEKLLEYWDMVEDRLFKIRHCMNIEGVVRELPLFQPPIEPGLLVKAVAAGVDIGSVLNDMNAPMPYYRFQFMLQKAIELCNDVQALGGALLSVLEKRDAEALALLHSTHEIELLNSIRTNKEQQVSEADETLASTKKSRDLVRYRKSHYSRLLTNSSTLSISSGSGDTGISIKPLYPVNEFELTQLVLAGGSLLAQSGQAAADVTAGILHLIPNTEAGAPTTMGATFGGSNVAQSLQTFGASLGVIASMLNTGASLSATMGSYKRRAEEWSFQKRIATKELEQYEQAGGQEGPQILAAKIRLAISEKDLEIHDQQIENAREIDTTMREKFTNQELYNWMVGQVSTVYFQAYQLAYDIAKRAEKTFRHELGLDDSNYIQFGYWDSLKKGLMTGERLHHDLKRMEIAYIAQNKREYELTKSISLAILDPIAMIKLREKGECFISIPEILFDLDHPGDYMRRIKTISLTIPCVTGPYTSVSATLTLQSNRIRKNTSGGSSYAWSGDFNDDRFNYNTGGIQCITTSSGQNDSGLFELNFRDERYLPFEGAGVISTWRIQLPNNFRQFDYDTISDIVIHMRYTAREGGEVLMRAANDEISRLFIEASTEVPLIRAFSAKQEFPSEWHQFLYPNAGADFHSLSLAMMQERFPFQFSDKTIDIKTMHIFLQLKEEWKAENEFAYNDSQALSLIVKNPEGGRPYAETDPAFTISGSLIENIPSVIAFQEISESAGLWLIEIPGVDISVDGTENRRLIPEDLSHPDNPLILNPDAIEDLIIVCYYSVSTS